MPEDTPHPETPRPAVYSHPCRSNPSAGAQPYTGATQPARPACQQQPLSPELPYAEQAVAPVLGVARGSVVARKPALPDLWTKNNDGKQSIVRAGRDAGLALRQFGYLAQATLPH